MKVEREENAMEGMREQSDFDSNRTLVMLILPPLPTFDASRITVEFGTSSDS
jgi:hypothetical protein